jgi:hypothetical protein
VLAVAQAFDWITVGVAVGAVVGRTGVLGDNASQLRSLAAHGDRLADHDGERPPATGQT